MTTFRARNRANLRRHDKREVAPQSTESPATPKTATPVSRRLPIKPVEASMPATTTRQPTRAYLPDRRRNQPATATQPTERPAFERRHTSRHRTDANTTLGLFIPCPRGLEPVLQNELQQLGATDLQTTDGGVSCCGTAETLMRINLHSRVASRVLLRLAQGSYHNERDINALALQVDWPAQFDAARTIKVKTDGIGSRVKSLDYISLTVKDAICDRFRQAQQNRPKVDTRAPDIRIQVFLSQSEVTLYLDSSGEALFKRGWRKTHGEAPLRENLAAGILLLADYNGTQPLLDPMCGSGTFLIEAADIALNRAPGRARSFAFEKWRSFNAVSWQQLQQNARQAERPAIPLPIRGSDIDQKMVEMTRTNLAHAGLDGLIDIETTEILTTRPHAPTGIIVTNPPYGIRLAEQDTLAVLYPQLGDWLKQHFTGWSAHLLSCDQRLPKLIRLTIKRRIPLYNGALDCRLFILPLVAGSARLSKT